MMFSMFKVRWKIILCYLSAKFYRFHSIEKKLFDNVIYLFIRPNISEDLNFPKQKNF